MDVRYTCANRNGIFVIRFFHLLRSLEILKLSRVASFLVEADYNRSQTEFNALMGYHVQCTHLNGNEQILRGTKLVRLGVPLVGSDGT